MMKYLTLALLLLCILFATLITALSVDENGVPLPDGPTPGGIFPHSEELVQTVGPEDIRNIQPPEGVTFPYSVMLVENNCKLRNQFRGARAFLHLEAGFYPSLQTRLVSGKPRIKFFELESDLKNAVVSPADLNQEQLLQMLSNISKDPNFYAPKGKVVEVFISRETTSDELVDLFERFNVERAYEFDITKRPDIHEDAEDRPVGQFSYDDELRKLNPDHDTAEPSPGYDFAAATAKAEEAVRKYQEQQMKELEAAEALIAAKNEVPAENNVEAGKAPIKDEL